jgi:hypothetical protein
LREVEELQACGHPNILATHPMTVEITKERHLTKRGDCVIAVAATRGLTDLSRQFKTLCKDQRTQITMEIEAEGIRELILGYGNSSLTLDHPKEMVARRSNYVSDRTLFVRADKAASDISRDLVRALRLPRTDVRIRLIAELPELTY